MRKALLFGLLWLLVLAPVRAHAIIPDNPPTSTYHEDTWDLRVRVINSTTSTYIPSPACSYSIWRGSDLYGNGWMGTDGDYATLSVLFQAYQWVGTHEVRLTCYDNETIVYVDVLPNSQLTFTLSSSYRVGEPIYIYAHYKDRYGSPLGGSICSASLYKNGVFQSNTPLSFSSYYYGTLSPVTSGSHSLEVSCEKTSYTPLTTSETFEVSKPTVAITLDQTTSQGTYGSTISLPFRVAPAGAECMVSYGNLAQASSTSYSTAYTYRATLNFLGDKTVTLSCAATDYTAAFRTITLTATAVRTRAEIGISSSSIYSFQTFYVTPGHYTGANSRITDANCTVVFNGTSHFTPSFQPVGLVAPAGPVATRVEVFCSKYGYELGQKALTLNVLPLPLEGHLIYPASVKQEEPFQMELALNTPNQIPCLLEGRLTTVSGLVVDDLSMNLLAEGPTSLPLNLSNSGVLAFTLTCSSPGYEDYLAEGTIKISVLSQSEGMRATFILALLTALLALGFVLIRRWI
ncbi:MAG TPA: hypothetical protein ENN60_01780 [archaeon]|nr:hypothetical protein [archaeon]